MNILHVIPTFAPAWRYGGPVVSSFGLTKALVRQGHSVTVITTNVDGDGVLDTPVNKAIDIEGVEVLYYPVTWPKWYYFSPHLGKALKSRVGEFHIAHIHSIFLWPTTVASYWCRRRGVPYLIRPAGALNPVTLQKRYARTSTSITGRAKKWLYLNTLGSLDINGAAGVHYTSELEMEAAQTVKGNVPDYLAPMAVDSSTSGTFTHIKDRFPHLKDQKLILFLSRIDPVKGLDILINALNCLNGKRDDFTLLVAGTGDPKYENYIRKLIQERDLESKTLFLGLVQGSEKEAIFRSADMFVLPSHHENFGLAVVEAMQRGIPVIISDGVNIHREITNSGAGLVRSLDPLEFSSAIEILLDDHNMRNKMGKAGKRLVGNRYSWDRSAKRITEIYKEIIEKRQPRSEVN